MGEHEKLTTEQKKLVDNNILLVYKITQRFRTLKTYEDIVQQAFLGLCDAAKKYDTNASNKFGTYAYYYILGYALEYLRFDKSIKPPLVPTKTSCPQLSMLSENIAQPFTGEENDDVILVSEIYSKVNDQEKLILRLMYEGFSQEEIAEKLHTHQWKISNALNTIRQKIKILEIENCNY